MSEKKEASALDWPEGAVSRNEEQVNSPSHYNQGDIECIDAMRQISSNGEFIAFCRLTAFKYLWRCGSKDAELQEVEKAQWYLGKAIEAMKGEG